jgi:putative peptidoglycan lipid II flippase
MSALPPPSDPVDPTSDAVLPPGNASDRSTEERRVARSAGTVGAATMLSRVLGLVREQVMASFFGAGLMTDAFNVAFRIPNLLRDLFAEGAMSSAFVPVFTEYREKRGEAEAWALGRQVMVSLAAALLVVCVAGWIAAPWLVRLFAPGFDQVPGKLGLTVTLTRVMLPFLPLVALAAACMGMLNAIGRFGAPALAPAWMNVGMVVFGLALIPVCERLGQPAILAMGVGVVIGGLAQFVTQIPGLLRAGFRFGWGVPFRHPGVARVAGLMLPATVGLAATQFNLFFSTLLASLLEQGSVSWLWYAFRLMQLPIGVFGVALATVSLPALSRAAVARDLPRLKTTLSATVRLVFVLTVPAALWLAAMARPLVALLYEHGRFGPADTVRTADALVMYCVGLPAFAAVGVFTRCFYALGDTRTPVRASFVAVGVNVALNLLLMQSLAHLGLALATSVTSIANLAQLAFYLRRRIGLLEGRRIARTFAKVGIAGAVAGAVCGGGALLVAPVVRGLAGDALVVVVGLAVGAGIAFAMMRVLRVEELAALEDLAGGLWRRVRGG